MTTDVQHAKARLGRYHAALTAERVLNPFVDGVFRRSIVASDAVRHADRDSVAGLVEAVDALRSDVLADAPLRDVICGVITALTASPTPETLKGPADE